MKTVVINNEARAFHIQVSAGVGKRDPQTGVTLPVPAEDQARLLILGPGVNMVDAEVWKRAKQNATVMMLLESTIQPTAAPEQMPEKVGLPMVVEGETLNDKEPLKALGLKAAQKLIAETLDTGVLKAWFDEELRPDVRRAIEAQIDAVERPKDLVKRQERRAAAAERTQQGVP